MREINVQQITDVIERLCIDANTHLPGDVKCAIESCRACEDGTIAQGVLDNIIENYKIADNENVPICQDTGMACVFLEIGQDVHIVGGDLREAVDEGVRRGYTNGYLRKSVVADPVRRGNTGDNTPAMLYTEIVPGENLKITVGPKGFGSENMSAIRMFKPSAGLQGIKDFIIETVETAGPNPCPPMAPSIRQLSLPRRPSCVPWIPIIPTPSMPSWRRRCFRRSTSWASAPRASAARPLPSV